MYFAISLLLTPQQFGLTPLQQSYEQFQAPTTMLALWLLRLFHLSSNLCFQEAKVAAHIEER